jgi:cytochrome o ubiquinol oxidase subunit III
MSASTSTADDVFAPPEHHGEEEAAHTVAMGFWLYLMSDCVLFAALFATFVVYAGNTAGGPGGQALFDLRGTLGETMFLLTSSLTCGFAVLAMQRQARGQVLFWLVVTFLFGLGFVGMELSEFLHMVAMGDGPDRSGFLSAFFTLVGTHGTHVTVGLIWMLVMMGQVMSKGLTTRVQSRLMRLSMFWHFLDIVWIGVFSVVYLRGMIL